jgi:hypothetical protein
MTVVKRILRYQGFSISPWQFVQPRSTNTATYTDIFCDDLTFLLYPGLSEVLEVVVISGLGLCQISEELYF